MSSSRHARPALRRSPWSRDALTHPCHHLAAAFALAPPQNAKCQTAMVARRCDPGRRGPDAHPIEASFGALPPLRARRTTDLIRGSCGDEPPGHWHRQSRWTHTIGCLKLALGRVLLMHTIDYEPIRPAPARLPAPRAPDPQPGRAGAPRTATFSSHSAAARGRARAIDLAAWPWLATVSPASLPHARSHAGAASQPPQPPWLALADDPRSTTLPTPARSPLSRRLVGRSGEPAVPRRWARPRRSWAAACYRQERLRAPWRGGGARHTRRSGCGGGGVNSV